MGGSVGGATHQIQTMNKTTTSVVLCAALSLGALINPALAADPVTAPAAVPLTLTTTAVSQYMFRGVRLGGASFQPTIEYGSGPLVLGLWIWWLAHRFVLPVAPPEQPLIAAAFLAGEAFLLFLLSRFLVGLARSEPNRLLRGPAC